MKRFADLKEQEILALAITNEEEDSRIYRGFADGLRAQYPSSAKMFEAMAEEEVNHRGMLYELYRAKFGEYLPLIRRQDVKGFVRHKPLWLVRPLGLDPVRKSAAEMEFETARFYRKAAESARDASVRELLVQLAEAEDKHENLAEELGETILTPRAHEPPEAASYCRRLLPWRLARGDGWSVRSSACTAVRRGARIFASIDERRRSCSSA